MPSRFAVVMLGAARKACVGPTDAVCTPLCDGEYVRMGHSNLQSMIWGPGCANLALVFQAFRYYKSCGLIEVQFFILNRMALTTSYSGAWVPRYMQFCTEKEPTFQGSWRLCMNSDSNAVCCSVISGSNAETLCPYIVLDSVCLVYCQGWKFAVCCSADGHQARSKLS
jgi:hypothetical protein